MSNENHGHEHSYSMGCQQCKDDIGWTASDGDPDRNRSSCFPGTALISTPRGQVSLSQIEAGDEVLSHESSGMLERAVVVKKLRHGSARLWKVTDENGDVVEATGHHPFLTERGWVQVRKLRENDTLLKIGRCGQVVLMRVARTERAKVAEQVFNLHTAFQHNFVVGNCIVHNFTYFKSVRTLWHRLFVDPQVGETTLGTLTGPFHSFLDRRYKKGCRNH